VLVYVSGSKSLKRKDANMLRIFKKRLLRRIHGPIKGNQGITMSFINHIMNQI
jgi:hypothetical protein